MHVSFLQSYCAQNLLVLEPCMFSTLLSCFPTNKKAPPVTPEHLHSFTHVHALVGPLPAVRTDSSQWERSVTTSGDRCHRTVTGETSGQECGRGNRGEVSEEGGEVTRQLLVDVTCRVFDSDRRFLFSVCFFLSVVFFFFGSVFWRLNFFFCGAVLLSGSFSWHVVHSMRKCHLSPSHSPCQKRDQWWGQIYYVIVKGGTYTLYLRHIDIYTYICTSYLITHTLILITYFIFDDWRGGWSGLPPALRIHFRVFFNQDFSQGGVG